MKKWLEVFLISLFILSSCQTAPEDSTLQNRIQSEAKDKSVESHPVEEKSITEDYKKEAESILSTMTLDEKIGQLFILAVRHTANGKPALKMDSYLQRFIEKYKPGGVILFTINFRTPDQTRELISGLQKASSIPLFVATDEEGGKVSRLGIVSEMDVIALPPAGELGETGDPELVEKAASVLAADLRDLGFNMNMAPVADITRNSPPDVIGTRSFGTDPQQTAEMVAAAVRGFQNNRISSVLKHFPGHGWVNGDTHNGMVEARGSKEEFETIDFLPFIRGIEAGADFVMSAHIQAPSLTGSSEPASLSHTIQTEILRNQLQFHGLLLTDAMDMGAISSYWSPAEAALQAFQAGIDIILMPANIPEARDSLKEAYENGEISDERLNESLIRILTTKIRRNIFRESPDIIDRITPELKSENHRNLKTSLNLTNK